MSLILKYRMQKALVINRDLSQQFNHLIKFSNSIFVKFDVKAIYNIQ